LTELETHRPRVSRTMTAECCGKLQKEHKVVCFGVGHGASGE